MFKFFLFLSCFFISASSQAKMQNKWNDLLANLQGTSYTQTLSSLVSQLAQKIRKETGAELLDLALYGQLSQHDQEKKKLTLVRIDYSLLVDRYLTEISEKKTELSVPEFSNLNIIFAASTQSYREIFADKIVQVIENNPSNWILSFRREQNWVQVRLFPLMEQAKSGETLRELIWLSQYHQDFRIRALAQSARQLRR